MRELYKIEFQGVKYDLDFNNGKVFYRKKLVGYEVYDDEHRMSSDSLSVQIR